LLAGLFFLSNCFYVASGVKLQQSTELFKSEAPNFSTLNFAPKALGTVCNISFRKLRGTRNDLTGQVTWAIFKWNIELLRSACCTERKVFPQKKLATSPYLTFVRWKKTVCQTASPATH